MSQVLNEVLLLKMLHELEKSSQPNELKPSIHTCSLAPPLHPRGAVGALELEDHSDKEIVKRTNWRNCMQVKKKGLEERHHTKAYTQQMREPPSPQGLAKNALEAQRTSMYPQNVFHTRPDYPTLNLEPFSLTPPMRATV